MDTDISLIKVKSSHSLGGGSGGGGSTGTGGGNSDSDIENEMLLDNCSNVTEERSRLRRGLAHIKQKVKAKSAGGNNISAVSSTNSTTNRKDVSPTSGSTSTLRRNFLRKRRKPQEIDQAEMATPSENLPVTSVNTSSNAPELHVLCMRPKRGIVNAKKDVEIESGVEVHEDIAPTSSGNFDSMGISKNVESGKNSKIEPVAFTEIKSNKLMSILKSSLYNYAERKLQLKTKESDASNGGNNKSAFVIFPVILLIAILTLTLLPLHDFIRGILATLLLITITEYSGFYLQKLIRYMFITYAPEKTEFKIPDYSKMSICQVPAVEEHKTIKAYTGWLNEANNYDPNTFTFAMTHSVYARLDGSVLKLSGTNARIPKRAMWNEPHIDNAKILFTDHRTYNLVGCRVELLPVGLAKKRYFNRKYPIQLIIKSNVDDVSVTSSQDDDFCKLEIKEARTTLIAQPQQQQQQIYEQIGVEADGQARNEKQIDFAATILNSDLQKLEKFVNTDDELNEMTVPCGDEVRLLLFTRCDRDKEDWYRRFIAASKGDVHDQSLRLSNVKFVEDIDLQVAATKTAVELTTPRGSRISQQQDTSKNSDDVNSIVTDDERVNSVDASGGGGSVQTPDIQFEKHGLDDDVLLEQPSDDTFAGLIMSSCVARNIHDYVRFMAQYQKACNQSKLPIYKRTNNQMHNLHRQRTKQRRAKRQEDELWKGIDQSLFLGPSGSIVWANVLIGRCLYSCLHDESLHAKIQDFLQKKLNSIKLPNFMESVNITQINLGGTPPLIHQVSRPLLDERGLWLDADITYEGLAHITVTTKMNLMRMKRPKQPNIIETVTTVLPDNIETISSNNASNDVQFDPTNNAIYDSDAESDGSASIESESSVLGTTASTVEGATQNDFFQSSPGNARRIFKIVDRIATSNLFQYATELPYVQRAMENMSANITLRVDLKGLVARGTFNMPPPPSDRIWMCFRGPPRLWIRAKPTLGDKTVDWSIVTNVIESKLCEAVNKYLVFPNMVDFTLPFLAKSSLDEYNNNINNNSNTN